MATPAMQGATAHIALGLPLDDPAKLRATNRRLESRQRPGSAGLTLFLAGRTATGAKVRWRMPPPHLRTPGMVQITSATRLYDFP